LEIISWLKVVQSDFSLCDEDSIRHFLNIPVYSPHNIPVAMMISPSMKQRQSLPPSKKSVSTPNNGTTPEATKTTIPETAEEPEEDYSIVISPDGLSKGCRINDFVFLDQSIEARRLYRDCSYLHSFRVRGPHYLSDKKKVSQFSKLTIILFQCFLHL